MLADPQSVTVNAVAIPLPRTSQGGNINVYTSVDGLTSMTTKQNISATRFRREVRLSQQKIAADPISALNALKGYSVYLVIDEPKAGFSDAELGYAIDALKAWLTSTNYNKVLGGEF
jgi:stage III sporulation protein SpoIIIAA